LFNTFAVYDVEDKFARQKDKPRAALEKTKWETLKRPLTCLTGVMSTRNQYSCQVTSPSGSLSSTARNAKEPGSRNHTDEPSAIPTLLNSVRLCWSEPVSQGVIAKQKLPDNKPPCKEKSLKSAVIQFPWQIKAVKTRAGASGLEKSKTQTSRKMGSLSNLFNGFITECLHGQRLSIRTQTCLGSPRASIQTCFEKHTNLMMWGLKFYLCIKDYAETFLESWLSHISTAKCLSCFSKTCGDGHNTTQYLRL